MPCVRSDCSMPALRTSQVPNDVHGVDEQSVILPVSHDPCASLRASSHLLSILPASLAAANLLQMGHAQPSLELWTVSSITQFKMRVFAVSADFYLSHDCGVLMFKSISTLYPL